MRHLFSAAIFISFCCLFPSAETVSAQLSPSQLSPLSTILNSDGSLRSGVAGSFETNGYRLANGPEGGPRFIAEEPSSGGGCVPDRWDTSFTTNGANGQVNTIITDGLGGYYIGGKFTSVQGVPAAGIAKWNGTVWSGFGSGLSGGSGASGEVNAIAISGNDVYVGGNFRAAGGAPAINVAKWNGSSWSPLGPGITSLRPVNAIAVLGSDIYLGGDYNLANGSPLVRWDGTSFSSVGTITGQVLALGVSEGTLYAGGNIGIVLNRADGLLKWDGTSWLSLGTAENTAIRAITFSGTDMYVAGKIFLSGTQDYSNVAKFDGTVWTPMQTFSNNGFINAIAVVGSEIYVGGYIPVPNAYQNIAKWNGSTWVAIGGGTNDWIYSLAASGNKLVVGGNFTTAGGKGAKNIAEYASGTWTAFSGNGLDNNVRAIAVAGSDVYVGGTFRTAGPLTANRIAKWDSVANTWSALGGGISGQFTDNSSIYAIAVAGDKVYAGGDFPTIGGVSAFNIAVWNGTSWSPLGPAGSGTNGRVTALEVHGSDLYVGGSFQSAGGVSTNRIAKWNGTSWSGFNSAPVPNTVTGIAFSGNDMYVSSITNANENPNYLLKYDGTTWTPLGAGMGGNGINSVAVLGTDVYVSGGFQTIGGVSANGVAKWNGSEWSALGSGFPVNHNSSLTTAGNDLIAVGEFTVAGGNPANRIARWNGTAWSALGNGLSHLNYSDRTITSAGGDLFVGGAFDTAGCNVSPFLARWREIVWTGSSSNDWHTAANWGSGTVPGVNAGITIQSNNASITSADVTVSSLIVTGGRTLSIGAGRILTVTGDLDLANGSLAGPGTLVVNGNLTLHSGNVTDLSSIILNGNLHLNGGKITGSGEVKVTSCRAGSITGGDSTSFVSSPLTRCVSDTGAYKFPVGADSAFAPLELTNVIGQGNLTVEHNTGPFSGSATGLPANRLQRWWNLTNEGITQADIKFDYLNSDIVGLEDQYRAYSIAGGAATLVPTNLDRVANRAAVADISTFSSWTLAEAESTSTGHLTGRITSPSGRGAAGVFVTLTDEGGVTRFGLTNHSGYYWFTNIPTFQFYTVSVRSKKFRFTTSARFVQVDEGVNGIDFATIDH